MSKMGRVITEFTERDVKSAKSKIVSGRTVYKLWYDIEVDLFSERGDLQIRTSYNGITKGNATIQFEESFDMMEG
jgi:hypothetical protein